jgi:adenosylhomocysteine nucleosidase
MALKKLFLVVFFTTFSLQVAGQSLAIMGALDQEIAILIDSMSQRKKILIGGIEFYKGKLKGHKVVVFKAGVGKVNAAYSTAILSQNFKLSSLIFTGVAGGLDPEALPGDLVIGEKLVQYDFGKVDSLGFEIWPFRKLSGGSHEELYVISDARLVQISQEAAEQVDFLPVANRKPQVFSGIIATGDLFVSSNEKANWLHKEFGALATEMEGAAVAHICRSLGIPFIIIRSCSDNANNNARMNFNQFVGPASENSARLVLAILEKMKNYPSPFTP